MMKMRDRTLQTVAFLSGLLISSAALSDEIAYDFSETKQSIAQLKALPRSIDDVLITISGTNFGPFGISGKCGYDSNWYCFGDCKTWSWWWKFPNYVWVKDNLQSKYTYVQRTAAGFDQSFSPIKSWLVTTLPAFSDYFNAEAGKMTAAEAVFSSPNASAAEKAAAKASIIQSLENINGQLDAGVAQINSGMLSLSGFNQGMNNALRAIDNTRASLNATIAADESKMNEELAGYPCDAGTARNGYHRIKNTVLAQFDSVTNKAASFGITSRETDKAVSLILGTVLNIQSAYNGVLTNLKNASITPSGAVQTLRINVAKSRWLDLATFAKQQFQ